MAERIIAAALADDEATVEAMARRACKRRGLDPDKAVYKGLLSDKWVPIPTWHSFKDEAIDDLAALRRHVLR